MSTPRYHLALEPSDILDVPPAPRPVPVRARLRATRNTIIGLVMLAMAAVLFAAFATRGYRGLWELFVFVGMGVAFGWGGWSILASALLMPGTYRRGRVVPTKLVLQGGGPPFKLRLGSGQPKDDESPIEMNNAWLSQGYQVWMSYKLDGVERTVHEQLDGGDRLVGVRIGNKVTAAVLVDPRRPTRAVLVTRDVTPR